jgi:hypothetical protein
MKLTLETHDLYSIIGSISSKGIGNRARELIDFDKDEKYNGSVLLTSQSVLPRHYCCGRERAHEAVGSSREGMKPMPTQLNPVRSAGQVGLVAEG